MTVVDPDASISELLDIAYEAVRSFNHRTLGATIVAPEAYRALGAAAALAGIFPQALSQLGDGVRASLSEFDVYDENRSPVKSVSQAQAELAAAAEAFERAYAHLSAAQEAINLQGVNSDSEGKLIRKPRLQALPSGDVEGENQG